MNLAESFTSFCAQMGLLCALLLVAFFIIKVGVWVVDGLYWLHYFTVKTPRFQRNLKDGDRARLLHSDVPVTVLSVGDRYAYVEVPGVSSTGKSLEISQLYPL